MVIVVMLSNDLVNVAPVDQRNAAFTCEPGSLL